MTDQVELEFPARAEYLALARLLVASSVAGEPMFAEERVDDLRLAVSEACTNAVEAQVAADDARVAAGEPPSDGLIRLTCRLTSERVEVEIDDQGQGFDPDDLTAHPAVSDPSRLDFERGLGIPLMRILTDEVEFRPTSQGTRVRMVVRAPAPPIRPKLSTGDRPG